MDELERLIADRNEVEMELDCINYNIRTGRESEEDVWNYINNLENQINYITRCIEDMDHS